MNVWKVNTYTKGRSHHILQVTQKLYNGTAVRRGNDTTSPRNEIINQDVRQGCLMSPPVCIYAATDEWQS
jgi:hypothetical protein